MANEVVMCEQVPDMPATMRYRWPWDPPNQWTPCSAHGQILLRQKAARLNRQVEFLPLVESNPEARPVERSERQQLHAAKLAAEDELKDAQARSTRLYQQTVELTADLKQARRKIEQLKATAQSKSDDLERSIQKRARLSSQVGQLTDQIATTNRLLEGEQDATDELNSMRRQLETTHSVRTALELELNATREKSELRIAELQRELEALRGD